MNSYKTIMKARKIEAEMDNDGFEQVEFSKLVADHYSQLTKNGKRIADFISQNQDEVAFMSAAEIAESLDLSEPTIGRFARTLGFHSYPDMSVMLQAKARHLANHSARIRSRLDDLRAAGDIYERVVTSEIDFLTESIHTLDRDAFNAAVELLCIHQRVFVFGLGPSISLVNMLEIRLTRSARHVIPLRTFGRELLEPLLLMNKDDLLIAIAFHSVNPYLQLILKIANEHMTPVILVTDTLSDMVGKKATVTLAARRGPVSAFHSLTVPMTILNTLLLALSSKDQERIMSNLDKLDQLRDSVQRMTDLHLPNNKI
jgi:DNA-binding MurR/RpiR family transcriptional regulator